MTRIENVHISCLGLTRRRMVVARTNAVKGKEGLAAAARCVLFNPDYVER